MGRWLGVRRIWPLKIVALPQRKQQREQGHHEVVHASPREQRFQPRLVILILRTSSPATLCTLITSTKARWWKKRWKQPTRILPSIGLKSKSMGRRFVRQNRIHSGLKARKDGSGLLILSPGWRYN